MLNPLRQAERHDPAGDYVRRNVPELAGVAGAKVLRSWKLDDRLDYPGPVIGLDEGREWFLAAARGSSRSDRCPHR